MIILLSINFIHLKLQFKNNKQDIHINHILLYFQFNWYIHYIYKYNLNLL